MKAWDQQQLMKIATALRDGKIPVCPGCAGNLIIQTASGIGETGVKVQCPACESSADMAIRITRYERRHYWFARIECDSEKAPATGHFSLSRLFSYARTNRATLILSSDAAELIASRVAEIAGSAGAEVMVGTICGSGEVQVRVSSHWKRSKRSRAGTARFQSARPATSGEIAYSWAIIPCEVRKRPLRRSQDHELYHRSSKYELRISVNSGSGRRWRGRSRRWKGRRGS